MPSIRTVSRFSKLAAGLGLVALAAAPLLAQDWKGRGRISGEVSDPNGDPISKAQVTILFRGQEGVGPTGIETNRKGRWSYLGLSTAPYTLVIAAEGYVPAEIDVKVNEYPTSPPPPVKTTLRSLESAAGASNGEAERLMLVLTQGNELMQAGNYPEARIKFEEVLAAVEDPAQRWSLERAVAGTYLEEGNTAEARARLESVLLGAPSPAEQVQVLQSIARSHYMDEDVDQSVQALERALAIEPDNVGSLRLIVDILVASGREVEAEPYMARLPAGEKIDPDALLNLGITAYNAGDIDSAQEKFEAVVDAYPDNANAQYYLGLVLMGKVQNAEAIAAFEKMLALDPEHPNAAEAEQFLDYLKSL